MRRINTEDTKNHGGPQRNRLAAFSHLFLFFSSKPSVLSVAFLCGLCALCVEILSALFARRRMRESLPLRRGFRLFRME